MNSRHDRSNEPTNSEVFAGVISGSATATYLGEVVPVSSRMPVQIVARLDALATRSGKSRNAMMNMVVQAGIESIQAHLSDEVMEELHFLERDALSTSLNADLSAKGGVSGEVY